MTDPANLDQAIQLLVYAKLLREPGTAIPKSRDKVLDRDDIIDQLSELNALPDEARQLTNDELARRLKDARAHETASQKFRTMFPDSDHDLSIMTTKEIQQELRVAVKKVPVGDRR